MAITIGSQLASQLEEIMRVQRVMNSLASIGPGLCEYDDYQAFANVVEYIEEAQNKLVDDFQIFVVRNVLPIVAHINDRI